MLKEMQAREQLIGHQPEGGISHHETESASAPVGTMNVSADKLANGDGGAGRKKSSKQRFLDREVCTACVLTQCFSASRLAHVSGKLWSFAGEKKGAVAG